MSHTALLRLIS
jgi:hypothetical protein